jgi:plasmid stability protein
MTVPAATLGLMTELHVHIPDDVAARLAAAAAERGVSAEEVAADLLTQNAPTAASNPNGFAFIGVGAGRPGAPSAAEAERMVEDGLDEGFAR